MPGGSFYVPFHGGTIIAPHETCRTVPLLKGITYERENKSPRQNTLHGGKPPAILCIWQKITTFARSIEI